MRPTNIGILAIEIVFPSLYVDQGELEEFDGVTTGKYTIGLGQSKMGFCTDREDINSLCLTVVSQLMEKHQIHPQEIGRLEVGTETILDKSKSVKTVLMQLFEEHNVYDIEGVDTKNACYGGTSALFNAVDWIESSNWNRRYALVVCGDVAVYAKGPARPTGGAGAIAMLIGPNAPLVFDSGLRVTFMKHAYDFYKPNLNSEYPIVDGKLSEECYLNALDHCYQSYRQKFKQKYPKCEKIGNDIFDYITFHTPYCKLIQKSIGRIYLNDFTLMDKNQIRLEKLKEFDNLKLNETYFDKNIEKTFLDLSKSVFESKTEKSLLLSNQIGNMYTASIYSCLVSLLINNEVHSLKGKRIGMFSYGSGLASSLFSIQVTDDIEKLQYFVKNLEYVKPLLEKRIKVRPEEFTLEMERREKIQHTIPYEPIGEIDILFTGTYYLKKVDELHRRFYERK